MIIDLRRFVEAERPHWEKLEQILKRLEADPYTKLDIRQLKEFHYLYERAAADLANIQTFAAEREIRGYLESLVARAYGEIHESREKRHRLRPLHWFFVTFPQTFRRHVVAFWLAVAITMAGSVFGGIVIAVDGDSKQVLLPFEHLQGSPAERVAKEEHAKEDRLAGRKATFSGYLMTHNTQVAIGVLALGMTWGIGTIILLFYNGIILGAVSIDYIAGGQTKFLLGWLLPHGVIEIPAILIAGQAGLVLASALIGWNKRATAGERFRAVSSDLVTLIAGVAVLLVWAGIVESFLSQYHEPVVPYAAKILFGLLELTLLATFLAFAGKKKIENER